MPRRLKVRALPSSCQHACMRRVVAAMVALTAPLWAPSAAQAQKNIDALTLLTTMSTAMQSLNYEGTFVHIQNGHTDLMHILHANDANGESERMRSLNGEAREIIRNNSLVTCIWPGSNDVILNKSKPRTLLRPINVPTSTSDVYQVSVSGDDRVAGQRASVVDVHARDDMRYGYRFWIDSSTGMMLRSMVLAANNKPLEELMFTAIEYPDAIDPERFEVDVNVERTQWVDASNSNPFPESAKVDKVSFENLPPGYIERSESLRKMAIRASGPVSHVVVSDGIATVSVYVEHVPRSEHETSATGPTSMGALNAYGYSLQDALVTAVGEVPGKTVESIARAARVNP